MKVLSIKEPYATLIMEKVKRIETRSWKTNYRGELYIHASKSKISKDKKEKKELMDLIKDKDMNYGKIICKCNLVDCIYMDNEFLKKIEKEKIEYICGEYKEGRYAWVLEDIVVLEDKIDAKGRLGIWNYKGD